jgi:hypothetical protein
VGDGLGVDVGEDAANKKKLAIASAILLIAFLTIIM